MVLGMSDHEGIHTDIRPTYPRPKPRKINILSKANCDQIQKDTAKFSFDYLKNHTLRSVIQIELYLKIMFRQCYKNMYHLNSYLPGTIYLGLIKRLNL